MKIFIIDQNIINKSQTYDICVLLLLYNNSIVFTIYYPYGATYLHRSLLHARVHDRRFVVCICYYYKPRHNIILIDRSRSNGVSMSPRGRMLYYARCNIIIYQRRQLRSRLQLPSAAPCCLLFGPRVNISCTLLLLFKYTFLDAFLALIMFRLNYCN